MRLKVLSIDDVVASKLCCGCGACASAAPESIHMVDAIEHGRRPIVDDPDDRAGQANAMSVCPGIELVQERREDSKIIRALERDWGPIREVWEGHASDPEIRHAGSSGGGASALALTAVEHLGMHGVLHIRARSDRPYLNETTLSRSREELLGAAGSRYAPASPCDRLDLIEQAPGPCVFIGKPCDVAAVQKMRRLRPELDEKIGLTIAFFCAGTPSTRGTIELLRESGIDDPEQLTSLRYRGRGWPGRWRAEYQTAPGEKKEASLTYEESWGFLEKHRQWRCYICPDHTGEFADISVGDPWYREIEDDDEGRSLFLARTPLGAKVLREAASAGFVTLETSEPSLLPLSQPNLLKTRGRLWGQVLALRLAGAPAPRYVGFYLFQAWRRHLSLNEKARSVLGTLRRIRRKSLKERLTIRELGETAATPEPKEAAC